MSFTLGTTWAVATWPIIEKSLLGCDGGRQVRKQDFSIADFLFKLHDCLRELQVNTCEPGQTLGILLGNHFFYLLLAEHTDLVTVVSQLSFQERQLYLGG